VFRPPASTRSSSPGARPTFRQCGGCSSTRFGSEKLDSGGQFESIAHGLALIGLEDDRSAWEVGSARPHEQGCKIKDTELTTLAGFVWLTNALTMACGLWF
jgi:hypothetical protein